MVFNETMLMPNTDFGSPISSPDGYCGISSPPSYSPSSPMMQALASSPAHDTSVSFYSPQHSAEASKASMDCRYPKDEPQSPFASVSGQLTTGLQSPPISDVVFTSMKEVTRPIHQPSHSVEETLMVLSALSDECSAENKLQKALSCKPKDAPASSFQSTLTFHQSFDNVIKQQQQFPDEDCEMAEVIQIIKSVPARAVTSDEETMNAKKKMKLSSTPEGGVSSLYTQDVQVAQQIGIDVQDAASISCNHHTNMEVFTVIKTPQMGSTSCISSGLKSTDNQQSNGMFDSNMGGVMMEVGDVFGKPDEVNKAMEDIIVTTVMQSLLAETGVSYDPLNWTQSDTLRVVQKYVEQFKFDSKVLTAFKQIAIDGQQLLTLPQDQLQEIFGDVACELNWHVTRWIAICNTQQQQRSRNNASFKATSSSGPIAHVGVDGINANDYFCPELQNIKTELNDIIEIALQLPVKQEPRVPSPQSFPTVPNNNDDQSFVSPPPPPEQFHRGYLSVPAMSPRPRVTYQNQHNGEQKLFANYVAKQEQPNLNNFSLYHGRQDHLIVPNHPVPGGSPMHGTLASPHSPGAPAEAQMPPSITQTPPSALSPRIMSNDPVNDASTFLEVSQMLQSSVSPRPSLFSDHQTGGGGFIDERADYASVVAKSNTGSPHSQPSASEDEPMESDDEGETDGSNNTSQIAPTTGGPTNRPQIQLWQFLKELLADNKKYGSYIRWLDRQEAIFKIEDSARVAQLWGERKNRPQMNYDKLSRSIRQYYNKNIMKKTERSQRLVYQFVHPYGQ